MSLIERIYAYLAEHNTLTLGTTGKDGAPHVCALFYAVEPDLTLYFLSEPKTLHARHIGDGARIAASVESNHQDWRTIRGLQLYGQASCCITIDETKVARSIYGRRFAFIARTETLAGPLNRASYYRILPTWVRLIDNSRGFGHKEEWRQT